MIKSFLFLSSFALCLNLILASVTVVFENRTEFTLLNEEDLNFFDAVEFCQRRNSSLARISSKEEFDFVDEAFGISNGSIEKVLDVTSFYIGLSDRTNEKIKDDSNTSRFTYVDNSTEGSDFYAVPKEFPWFKTQPNNKDDNQPCVRWQTDENAWFDGSCSIKRQFLCRTDLEVEEEPNGGDDGSNGDNGDGDNGDDGGDGKGNGKEEVDEGVFEGLRFYILVSVGALCMVLSLLLVLHRRKKNQLAAVKRRAANWMSGNPAKATGQSAAARYQDEDYDSVATPIGGYLETIAATL